VINRAAALTWWGEAPVRCQDIGNTNGQHIGNRMAKTWVTLMAKTWVTTGDLSKLESGV